MLRLIIAAVLASACLAYPQRREGAPQDAANLQSFNPADMQAMQMPAMPGMQGMQGLQPMQPMPAAMGGGQFPFQPMAPNFGMGYKRDLDEELEKRRHSQFNTPENNMASFGADDNSFENLVNFVKDNGDSRPFANMEGDATDMGNFQPMAENEEGKYRFFDNKQQ